MKASLARKLSAAIHALPRFFGLLLVTSSLAPLAAMATDFSSSNFISRDPVLSAGGGYATSSSFQLWSAFSEPAIGKSTSNSKELRAGFLYFGAVSAATPTPTPTPTPTTPPGTGLGRSPTPPGAPPPPPSFPPPILRPIISFITGELVPPGCVSINRSDLNCDGHVDLRDLSILFTKPRIITGRILSLLFSDWTRKLPIPRPEPETGLVIQGQTPKRSPVPPLAQVAEVVTSEREKSSEPSKISLFFKNILNFIKNAFRFIVKIFSL